MMFGWVDGPKPSRQDAAFAREIVNEAFEVKRKLGSGPEEEPCAVCLAMDLARQRLGREPMITSEDDAWLTEELTPGMAAVLQEAIRRQSELL